MTEYGLSRDFNINNMTGAASGTVPVYPSGVHEFTLDFNGVRVAQYLDVLCFVDQCVAYVFFSLLTFVFVCPSFYGFTPLVSSNFSFNRDCVDIQQLL